MSVPLRGLRLRLRRGRRRAARGLSRLARRWDRRPGRLGCPDCGVREKVDFVPARGMSVRSATAIVDAVDDLVRSRGWDGDARWPTSRAPPGVSRQTVYNEFGTRHELVQAYVLREIEALVAAVEAHVRTHPDDARQALVRRVRAVPEARLGRAARAHHRRRRRGRRADPAADLDRPGGRHRRASAR